MRFLPLMYRYVLKKEMEKVKKGKTIRVIRNKKAERRKKIIRGLSILYLLVMLGIAGICAFFTFVIGMPPLRIMWKVFVFFMGIMLILFVWGGFVLANSPRTVKDTK